MKTQRMAFVVFTALAILFSTVFVSRSAGAARVEETEIALEAFMAPTLGYDNNDNIQVVAHGYLPNACYQVGRTEVTPISATRTFRVRQFALKMLDGLCADENSLPNYMKKLIPFTTVTAIGVLDVGDYSFEYLKAPATVATRSLNVGMATTMNIDSLPYAAVSGAMSPDVINGIDEIKVTLSGVLNSSCTKLDETLKVLKQKDVYVMLPTIHVVPGPCLQVLVPFAKEINLGRAAAPGHYLVHVRSMNGQSVNKVVLVHR